MYGNVPSLSSGNVPSVTDHQLEVVVVVDGGRYVIVVGYKLIRGYLRAYIRTHTYMNIMITIFLFANNFKNVQTLPSLPSGESKVSKNSL
jgi:hypothetical protein